MLGGERTAAAVHFRCGRGGVNLLGCKQLAMPCEERPLLRPERFATFLHGSAPKQGRRKSGVATIGAMPKLLLNLRGVPDDEADDVRAVLAAQRIAFYETTPSFWGISSGAIWVTEDADFAAAKHAFEDYEQQRSARVRAEYAAAKLAGTAETLGSLLRDDPLRVVMTVLGILIVLGLATVPFFLL